MNRSVAIDATTISFDFDNNIPPAAPIVKVETPSPDPYPYPEPEYLDTFPSYDSTSATSSFWVRANDPLCEPFIATPEPTISPPIFVTEPMQLYPTLIAPSLPSDSMIQNDNYELPSPLSLLPMLPLLPSQSTSSNGELSAQPHFPMEELNFYPVLPAFEIAFMSNNSFEQYIYPQQQPQCEFVMLCELHPCDDSALIYEQL